MQTNRPAKPTTNRAPGLVKTSPNGPPRSVTRATTALMAEHVGAGQDRRSWYEIQVGFAAREGADMHALLSGRRTRREKIARYRCWATLFSLGNSQSAIARAYGCDPSAVCDALKKSPFARVEE